MIHRTIELGEGVTLKTYVQEPSGEKYETSFSGEKKPAVLILPGGSYLYVSEREGEPVALRFLKEGIQAFVLSYRCGDESMYPNPIIDLLKAVEHLKGHAEYYDIDPDNISLVGFSAGGHLAALYGGIYHQEEVKALGFEPFKPKTLILAYPVLMIGGKSMERFKDYDLKAMLGSFMNTFDVRTSPYKHLHPDYPDTFLFFIKDDELIDPTDSFAFVTKALSLGVKIETHFFDEGVHGLSTADDLSCQDREYPKRLGVWLDLAINWLKEKM